MAEESLTLACDNNDSIEYHIVTLFEKIEELRRNNCDKNLSINDDYRTHRGGVNHKSIHVELRSVEFWRSVIAECMASFFYVFIVCGAAAGSGVGASLSSVLLATALATGFAMTTLTHCFIHISGAHINPAVTLAMAVTRNVSPIRAIMFLLAQCGGSIAAAAVLYGVTVPKYTGNLSAAVAQTVHLATWERFGVEFVLTFIIVFTYFVSMDSYRKSLFNSSALTIGAAYTTCTFVSMPYLNPARSLGPSFVLNKWDNHWVYWFGPMVGGVLSGLIYEFIFHSRRRFQTQNGKSKHHHHHHHRSIDGVDESSTRSMPSCDDDDDHDNYDDLEKAANMNKYHGSQHGGASNYNTYRAAPPPTMGANINAATAGTTNGIMSTIGGINYCQNSQTYGTTNLQHQTTNHQSTTKLNRVESIYGGTKSLYCKSPPLTRANLNRSQSVYTKSNCNINLLLPRSGPLIPAQSMYPIRIVQQQPNQQSPNNQQQNQHQISSNQAHVQNQNVQNQIQQQTSSNQQQSTTNQQIQQTNQQIQQQAVVNRSSDPNYGVLPLNMQNTLARQQQQNQQQTINNNGGGSNTNYNTIEMIRPSPPPPLPPPSSSSSTSSTTITMRERERDRDASSYHHHYQHQSSHHQQASHHQPAQHHQNHHQINRTLQQQQQQQQQCNTLTLPPQYK